MTDGEIRKVDKETKKITIKHGEITNLDMPGMTMLFQVKDPAMLDMVKPGDKVKFRAEKAALAVLPGLHGPRLPLLVAASYSARACTCLQ